MSDHTVVDGSLFFRARRRSARQRPPEPRVLRPLYLDGIGVYELLHLLRHTDLTVTTDARPKRGWVRRLRAIENGRKAMGER